MVAEYASVDWGTSRCRLRWVVGDEIRSEASSDEGAGVLASRGGDRAAHFAAALRGLRRAAGVPGSLPIVASGMVGSSIGWKELEYATLPYPLDASRAVVERLEPEAFDGDVTLVSGVRAALDVLRGEECQVLGLARLRPEIASGATLVLPGTHSKHVIVADGAIVDFRTYLTGELFELLATRSVLAHSVDRTLASFELEAETGPLRAALRLGIEEERRHGLAGALFTTRARQLLAGATRVEGAAFLGGAVVAAELARLADDSIRGPIVLAASGPLAPFYRAVLAELARVDRLAGHAVVHVDERDVDRSAAIGHRVISSARERRDDS